jgi:hypothetical protein
LNKVPKQAATKQVYVNRTTSYAGSNLFPTEYVVPPFEVVKEEIPIDTLVLIKNRHNMLPIVPGASISLTLNDAKKTKIEGPYSILHLDTLVIGESIIPFSSIKSISVDRNQSNKIANATLGVIGLGVIVGGAAMYVTPPASILYSPNRKRAEARMLTVIGVFTAIVGFNNSSGQKRYNLKSKKLSSTSSMRIWKENNSLDFRKNHPLAIVAIISVYPMLFLSSGSIVGFVGLGVFLLSSILARRSVKRNPTKYKSIFEKKR